jgi:pantoate kinase
MKGVAFCPAHVTGFFKAEIGKNQSSPEFSGSLGAGFSLVDGVTTSVQVTPSDSSSVEISISGHQPDNTMVSEFVVNEFLNKINNKNFNLKISHNVSIPVGYGLGCSGAVALSLAMALNDALDAKMTREEVGQLAHRAEVICKTGLGDVLASYHGGFEIRTKPGAPGIGSLKKIDSDSKVIMICFAPISTKKFIEEKIEMINGLGGKMVNKLLETNDSNDFQDMSVEFAKYVQVMTPRMERVISDLQSNGIKCGVALFGETIFSIIPAELESKVLEILSKYQEGIIINSKIDNTGARLE